MRCLAVFAGLAAIAVATPVLERKEAAASEIDTESIADADKVSFLSKEVRQAYIDRDGAALANYSLNAQHDYERLTRTMYDTQLSPFNRKTIGGKVVHFYGNESTYIWATVVETEGPEPEEFDLDAPLESDSKPEVVHKAKIEIGHYSAAGGQASSFLVQVPRFTTDAVLSLAVFNLVQRSIHNILQGKIPAAKRLIEAKDEMKNVMKSFRERKIDAKTAVDLMGEAIEKKQLAEVAAVAETAQMSKITRYLTKNSKFFSGAVGFVASVVGTLLFDTLVIPFVIQDFVVKVNVVNLDERAWTVDKWHGDNAIVVGGGDGFKPTTLDPPSGRTVPFHPELQADLKEASDVTYTFQNSHNWFAGLGVALQVTSSQDPQTGFMVGYDCPYSKDNSLAIQAGVPKSPEDWYDDSANWPQSKPLSVNDTLTIDGEQVEVKAVTDALSGNGNRVYQVWVTVGSDNLLE